MAPRVAAAHQRGTYRTLRTVKTQSNGVIRDVEDEKSSGVLSLYPRGVTLKTFSLHTISDPSSPGPRIRRSSLGTFASCLVGWLESAGRSHARSSAGGLLEVVTDTTEISCLLTGDSRVRLMGGVTGSLTRYQGLLASELGYNMPVTIPAIKEDLLREQTLQICKPLNIWFFREILVKAKCPGRGQNSFVQWKLKSPI